MPRGVCMEIAKEFKTVEKGVRYILENSEWCRNDDRPLVVYYWHYINGVSIFLPEKVLKHLTPPETIRRVRQKIQAGGDLIPTAPEVAEKRRIRQKAMREYFSKRKGGECNG